MKTALPFAFLLAIGAGTGLLMNAADSTDFQLPPETARFAPGRGAELATANCLLCHSADYIITQPPLTRTQWLAIVTKMREKFGAPVPATMVDPIVDYLARTYGPAEGQKPAR